MFIKYKQKYVKCFCECGFMIHVLFEQGLTSQVIVLREGFCNDWKYLDFRKNLFKFNDC